MQTITIIGPRIMSWRGLHAYIAGVFFRYRQDDACIADAVVIPKALATSAGQILETIPSHIRFYATPNIVVTNTICAAKPPRNVRTRIPGMANVKQRKCASRAQK